MKTSSPGNVPPPGLSPQSLIEAAHDTDGQLLSPLAAERQARRQAEQAHEEKLRQRGARIQAANEAVHAYMRESGTRNYPQAFGYIQRTRPELFAQMQVLAGQAIIENPRRARIQAANDAVSDYMRESGTCNYPAAFTHILRTRPELFAQMQVPVGLPVASIERAANRLAAAANGEPLPPGAHWVTINGRHVLIDGEGEPWTAPAHDQNGASPEQRLAKAATLPRDQRGRFVMLDGAAALQSEDDQKAATSAAFQRWLAQRHQPAPARPTLLDEVNRQQWQMLGEVARGFLKDGLLDTLENLPKALLEMTGPVQLYRLVQLLRQAAANPQGLWAGLKEIERERLQAVLAKLKELTTTPRGVGELLFDVVSIWLGGEAITAFKESELGVKLAAGLKGTSKSALSLVPKPPTSILSDTSNNALRTLGSRAVRNTEHLTDEQWSQIQTHISELGLNPEDFLRSTHVSCFSDLMDKALLGPDVFPASTGAAGRSVFGRITPRAAVAHEAGHMITTRAGTSFEAGSLRDEVGAALTARQLPGLSSMERYQLLRDAAERAKAQGTTVRTLLEQP